MRRRTKPQAAPVESAAPLPVAGSRRGLVVRWRERAIARRVAGVLSTPAVVALAPVVVGVVLVAVALGVLLGLALAGEGSEC